jgi:hypothetical protein
MYPVRNCAACGSAARVWETTRKFGVESNALYRCDKENCRALFTVMTKAGKGVALVLAGPLVLILVAAATIKMSPRDGSMAPLAFIVGLLLALFGVSAVKQLLAERANPVR